MSEIEEMKQQLYRVLNSLGAGNKGQEALKEILALNRSFGFEKASEAMAAGHIQPYKDFIAKWQKH